MKTYLFIAIACLLSSIDSNAQEFPVLNKKPGVIKGCESAKDRLACGEEKLRTIAFEALQEEDLQMLIDSTKKDIIFMNTVIGFNKKKKINPKKSSVKFYESELKPFTIPLSFAIETLPFELNPEFSANGTRFSNYLFLQIDRETNTITPLPDYKPRRIPFSGPDKYIVFPGCRSRMSNAKLRKCMSEKISKHVSKYYNTKIATKNKIYGMQKILVQFTVSKKGNPIKIKVKAKYPVLAAEMERVIQMLPVMKPAIIENTPVNVRFALPVIFDVQ
ncbi:MAG: hypothetical protein AAF617_11475 [Bacteroidota bacterium]